MQDYNLAQFFQQSGMARNQQMELIQFVTEQPEETIAGWGENYDRMPDFYKGMVMGSVVTIAKLEQLKAERQQQQTNQDLQRQYVADTCYGMMAMGMAAMQSYHQRSMQQSLTMAQLAAMRW